MSETTGVITELQRLVKELDLSVLPDAIRIGPEGYAQIVASAQEGKAKVCEVFGLRIISDPTVKPGQIWGRVDGEWRVIFEEPKT